MRFDWKWNISDLKQDKPVKVFSTFSCGGGSSLGYKRAGFDVIGNVEIDPKVNDLYIRNNKPRFNYCEDLRDFNQRDDLPEELFDLDILDGSPPCTSFSTAGVRDRDWGKKKKFREGQKVQTLDDLFFVFLDTVEKLNPRIVVAENVPGMLTGKAKGYVNEIVKRFRSLGYELQIFSLNAAHMDVPQSRHRAFFIANRCGFGKLKLEFDNEPIRFKEVRSPRGKPIGNSGMAKNFLEHATENDHKFADVAKRISGDGRSYFGSQIVSDKRVCQTVASGGAYYRFYDKMAMSDEDFRNVQSFPQDYDFAGRGVQYITGMSVPPNMMANIAMEIWEQWLS